jgi:hypothetical protein
VERKPIYGLVSKPRKTFKSEMVSGKMADINNRFQNAFRFMKLNDFLGD